MWALSLLVQRQQSTAIQRAFQKPERNPSATLIADDPKSPYHDLRRRDVQFITLYGGRGAAKDWEISAELIQRATREKLLILCTREYQNSIADSTHRVLKGTIHRLGFSSYFRITDKSIKSLRGTEFIFKGLHHNIEEIKSTEGVDVTWVSEAQSTTEDSWVNLLPTVFRRPGSQLITSFNVTDEFSATHTRLVTHAPEGSIVHKVNYTENPYFPPLLKKLMEADKARDLDLYNHIWLGHARRQSAAGVLGGRYRVQTFADDLWKQAQRLFYGADFGFSADPSTLVRQFVLPLAKVKELKLEGHDDPKRQCDRLYIEYEAGDYHVELDELPALYDTVPGSREWPIKADCARPETISHLHGKGFNISAAEKWNGSVEDGVAHLRSHDIIIHPRCQKTAEEAYLYRHKVDPRVLDPRTNAPIVLPTIVDAHNHYIDASRYGLDGHIQRRGGMATWLKLAQQ